MKSVIIGRGNLGLDLAQALTIVGHNVEILSRSTGYNWRTGHPSLKDADYVWVTAGHGSVDAAANDPEGCFDTHMHMPLKLAMTLPQDTRLICFSSDYAASESQPWSPGMTNVAPRSLYATSKIAMELGLKSLGRKNTFCVRVGSLYGSHYPERCFPGRILQRFPKPCKVMMPMNRTSPTPTPWIANVLSRHLYMFQGDFRVFHCGPKGMVSVVTWAKIVLGDQYEIESKGFDQTRPLVANLQCSFENPPEWEELWRLHWLQQTYHAKCAIEPSI
jgi:dTDP-4-dehydrorhamnose reductase